MNAAVLCAVNFIAIAACGLGLIECLIGMLDQRFSCLLKQCFGGDAGANSDGVDLRQ